jgi:DNA invertase Pin-like site-specific DNA recombinase
MNKITAEHLARCAYVYIRQSSPGQVQNNLESRRRQYALASRARELGWHEVEIVDEDLGISGAGTHRPGFERLLRSLCDGRVGAVFSVEASRLARNGRDWHTLLEFCSVVNALLIDPEGVYDLRKTDDRLLLGMKGTISEMELANFRERAQSALKQKAQRGALFARVPIGYVKAQDDRVEKTPDARVRGAIELIFRKFAELASVRQVYFWLVQQQILLPVVRGRVDAQEVLWRPARYHAVHSVLKNPMYAGAYTYGRSKMTARIEDGHKRVVRQLRRKREDWDVLIRDHHEGYIDWDVYQSNQALIAHNENAKGAAVRGSVKRGSALLVGLLRCGHCGGRILAQYPKRKGVRYQCSIYVLNREKAPCVSFGGLRAEQAISEQVLQCLTPLAVRSAMEAIDQLQGTTDERIRQKLLALEQARYEVARARRQYDVVDPLNRLVASELERRWNTALITQSQLDSELVALQRERPGSLSESTKRELLGLATDIPALWNHPHSSPEHKKRILRIALKEIVVTSEENTFRFVLHWQGGDHTQVQLQKNRTGHHRFVVGSDVIEMVRALARIETDARIASILNRAEHRTPHGQMWTAMHVCSLRNRHSIVVYRDGERQERGEIFVGEAAAILDLTQSTVLRLIRLRQLSATQTCANAPWVLRKTDVEQLFVERSRRSSPPDVASNQMALEVQ